MCGIAGTFALQGVSVSDLLDRLRHRGPDGDGVATSGSATHGHVRLALLDPSPASAQPYRQGTGLLSFNGEIWNFRQLRNALAQEGVAARTTGDTEVLALALDRWGVDATLPRLEGMFAFAWSKGGTHVLVRDRFGKIPLYVHRRGYGFAWASERKALTRSLPAAALPPGTVLDLTSGKVRTWYALDRIQASRPDLPRLLEEGVRDRLVADAPLCCLISGGLDSSIILTLAHRAKPDIVAYTAVLDPAAADLAAARRLCCELNLTLVEVPVSRPTSASLAEAVRVIELPSKAQAEITALCLPLARRIAADGFKACLSGEAADELFGGYGSMCIKGSSADDAGWRAIRLGQVAKMARGNFVRCNKAFMAHGVECRLPFMHRPLVEGVLDMSKAECPPGKAALKRAAHGIVPPWVIRRVKDTFQGGSGMAAAAASVVADPAAFYRAEVGRFYGPSALARGAA
jgi:asparagine synthase (glutamine-hydrolysing)